VNIQYSISYSVLLLVVL